MTILSILIMLCSCTTHSPVRLAKKIILEQKATDDQGKLVVKKKILKNHKIYIKKYFLRMHGQSPVAIINNKAVDLAVQGKFREAEILFQDVITEARSEAAAYNNLAVIYELFNDSKDANRFYLKAISIAPTNQCVKNNFLSFEETKYVYEHNTHLLRK